MITAADIENLKPETCNECCHCHVVYSLLQHNYVLTYCELNGKTLTNVASETIQRPDDCRLGAG